MRFFKLSVLLSAVAVVAGCVAAPAASGSTEAVVRPGPAFPSVFAVSLWDMPAGAETGYGARIALLSSRTGRLVRWLTPLRRNVYDSVLNVHDGWVYFSRGSAVWRVAEAGGPAQLVQAGASDYAVSQDGKDIAYVTTVDRGLVAEIVARNLATGKQNAIVMATDPCDGCNNNWPPDIQGLSWAPDDAHLAVTYNQTAALSNVMVFDAFTARTFNDGRTAPAPCELGGIGGLCTEYDSGYLTSGALVYVIMRLSRGGTTLDSLYSWQGSRITVLLSLSNGIPYVTPQGQAIWALGPTAANQPWAIWRWTGGAPVRVDTLPLPGEAAYTQAGPAAW